MNTYLLYICIGIPIFLFAQKETPIKDSISPVQYYIIEGDTLYTDIRLDEVILLGKLKFRNTLEKRKYLILRRKTRKVYPYAKLAAEKLVALNKELETITSKRRRRKHIKKLQKYLEGEFTDELKKFTRTEGQILVKLVYRQTGVTMFHLIKEYRSGWKAFWYNTTASLFNISLKRKFDPLMIEEDYWIEDILQRSFQANILEEQQSVLNFSFIAAKEKWAYKTKDIQPKK